ncbi:hypothetical protein [Thermocatellispora tengchongensis]|uniref:hypothetical protein n=1 Tax=Thermocatellispora tengchongensis TaxID=1073253 RepID=UPI003631246E
MVGDVTPVFDFDASTRERQVQARDKTTGEPVWSVPVMDGDPSVKAASKTMAIKFVGNPRRCPRLLRDWPGCRSFRWSSTG